MGTPKTVQAIGQLLSSHMLDTQAGFRTERGTRDSNCQSTIDYGKSTRISKRILLLLNRLQQSIRLCGSWGTLECTQRNGDANTFNCPHQEPVYQPRIIGENRIWKKQLVQHWLEGTTGVHPITLLIQSIC